MKQSAILKAFIATAAVLAAVMGDAAVESISDAGVLWHGRYTDRSSVDLLPVALIALIGLALTLGSLLSAYLSGSRQMTRRFVVSSARVLTPHQIMRVVPSIFGLQLVVLLVMETLEQVVVYGHASGGTLWLGGPIVASLLIHAIAAIVSAFGIASSLRRLADALLRAVACIFGEYLPFERSRPLFLLRPGRRPSGLQFARVRCTVQRRGPPRAGRRR
jgi:hypothetical protein